MIVKSCTSLTTTSRLSCILMLPIMLMGHTYVRNVKSKGTRSKNPSGFWVVHFMVHKHDGPPLKKRPMPSTGRCYALTTLSAASHLPFGLITEISFFLITMAHARSCNGNWIFSITMLLSNMSRAKLISQPTFSADLWPDQVLSQYSTS